MSSFKSYLISKDVLDLTKSGMSKKKAGGVQYLLPFSVRSLVPPDSLLLVDRTSQVYSRTCRSPSPCRSTERFYLLSLEHCRV